MDAHSPPALLPSKAFAKPGSSWQEQPGLAYLLLLLLAALLILSATQGGSTIHDSLAIYWVWADQFTAELARGILYPRWLPLSDGGLGSPVFYFYPPLAFHLTGVFGLAGLSTYGSLVAAFGSAFAASGIGCWHWLRGRSNHPLLAAAFFMAAPYHLFDYTVRGALAESVAIALIPPLAIGLRRIAERRGGLVLTSLCYGAMILTHMPLALLVGLFFFAPYALLHRKRMAQFALAGSLGTALAAVYLVPALGLDAYRDVSLLYRSPNLTTGYWSIYNPHWTDPNYAAVLAICAAIIIAAAFAAVRRRDGWAISAIAIATIVAGVVPLIWSLPLLRDVQFPCRALPIAEFALATSLARLPPEPRGVAVPIVPALVLSLLLARGFNLSGDDVRQLEAVHPDVYEYLPKGVMRPGQTSTTLREVLASRIPPPHVPKMIVEPHFYFPSWSCGTEEPRTQLLIHEPSCKPQIIWTMTEKIGAAISALTMLLLLLLGFCRSRRVSRRP